MNDTLYYPGDSFYVPVGVDIAVLAAPAGAPWMKISEGMDFVAQIKPKRVFPTHDGVLSAAGLGLVNARYTDVVKPSGGEYVALQPGEFLDV